MRYEEIAPPPPLAGAVRYFWILEAVQEHGSFRVLADGYPGLIFTYRNRFSEVCPHSGEVAEAPQCFLFGLLQRYKDLQVNGPYGILGVSFFPDALHAVLNDAATKITDLSPDVEDFFGGEGKRLRDRLQNATENTERIAHIARFLSKKLRPGQERLITAGVSLVRRSKGEMKIGEICRELRISPRHFERRFSELVGVSPKAYSRIVRFQRALRFSAPARNLADLALQCGYSDQSHFIREFKAFAGFSPKSYFSEERELAENIIHLD